MCIRDRVTKSTSSLTQKPIEAVKSMTYPFPGYVDLYCLKDYRNKIDDQDKVIISEAVENYKAAGVITTVISASVVQMYPTIIVFSPKSFLSQIPATLPDDIRASALEYANTVGIGVDFDRNSFYSYMYDRYSQYGALFIYYNYDNLSLIHI